MITFFEPGLQKSRKFFHKATVVTIKYDPALTES